MKRALLLIALVACKKASPSQSSTPKPKTFGAASAPLIPNVTPFCSTVVDGGVYGCPSSWTQGTWVIDPQNTTTGCASDGNLTCSSATCVAGVPGVADGPCKTFTQIAARWGTYSPRFRQNVLITLLSNQNNDDTDPIYISPYIENLSWVVVQGTKTPVQSGTVGSSGFQSQNRTSGLLYNLPLGAGLTAGELVQITDSGTTYEAFLFSNTSGNVWAPTEPLALASTTAVGFTFGNVAAEGAANIGDAYSVYSLTNANVVDVEPVCETFAPSSHFGTCGVYLYNLNVLNPPGQGGRGPLNIGGNVEIASSSVQRMLGGRGSRDVPGTTSTNFAYSQELYNVYVNGGMFPMGEFTAIPLAQDASFLILGGGLFGGLIYRLGNVSMQQDVYLSGATHGLYLMLGGRLAGVYIDTGFELANYAETSVLPDLNNTNSTVWGPGEFNIYAHTTYPSGDGGAEASLLVGTTGALLIDAQNKACVGIPSTDGGGIGNGTMACNWTINQANLDNNFGPTKGCLWVPGGFSLCNFP